MSESVSESEGMSEDRTLLVSECVSEVLKNFVSESASASTLVRVRPTLPWSSVFGNNFHKNFDCKTLILFSETNYRAFQVNQFYIQRLGL